MANSTTQLLSTPSLKCITFILLLIFSISAYSLHLDDESSAFIKENPSITIGVMTDSEPYSWIENGQMMGFSIDVLEEISSHTGLKFEYRPGSWSEIFPAFLRGEIDAIDEISYQPDRAELILFTEPYYFRNQVIMHNIARPLTAFDSLEDLKPYRIGTVRDIYTLQLLSEQGLDITEYDAIPNLVQALAFGWVDAIIGPELTLNFLAERAGFSHVSTLTRAPLRGAEHEDFRIGVLKENKILHRILSQGLQAIPPERLSQMLGVWKEYGGQTFTNSNTFRLTEQQASYVRRLGPLKVGFMREYAPFSFVDNENLQGLTVDVLTRIQDMTGLQVIPVTDRWSVLFDLFQRGEIDIITNISDKPARHEFTRFSTSYYVIPNVAFTRNSNFQLEDIDDLTGKRIAIGAGIFYEDQLRQRFGDKVVGFASLDSMFKALSEGSIDVVVTALPNGNHWVRELGLTDVRIAGEFVIDDIKGEDLRFGVRPALDPLVDIIDLALKNISPTERRTIENRWLGAESRRHSDNQHPEILLDEAEISFLTERDRRLSVCIHPDWMPIEGIDEYSRHTGMSSDFLRLFATRFNLSFDLEVTGSWQESLTAIRAGQCDLLPTAVQTTERLTYLDFTTSYLSIPNIMLGRVEAPFIDSPHQLGNVTVGIVEDYAYTELLKIRYPNLRFVIVNNEEDGLRRLQRGEVEAYISTLTTASYLLQELGLADIKVIGRVHVDRPLSIATRNEFPELGSLAQKMVDSLTEQDLQNIERHWRTVQLEENIDYSIVWKLVTGGFVIVLIMFVWNRKLGALNRKLEEANQRLAELSILDSLTGVGNRKYFDQTFEQSFRWCQRHQVGFAVAMIDIDHFKKINDTWGHQVGDDCLVALGQCLKTHARRETDHIARVGGEEFVIYETYENESDTLSRFERLRIDVEKIKIPVENEMISFTLSIGLATGIPNQIDSAEDFMKCADRALYEGKRTGRNRVVHDPILHA